MSTEFAIAEVMPGKLNALVKNLMSQMDISDPNEAVRRINSGEWVVSQLVHSWREENGVIYFTLVSDGTTGDEWADWFKANKYNLGSEAEFVLRSTSFRPTKGVTYEIAVLKGELFADKERTTSNIRAFAGERRLETPNAEVACLIRRMFSDKELEAMGLWAIIGLHEPINGSDGSPDLLGADRSGSARGLGAFDGKPDCRWLREDGFAFLVPQA